MARWRCQNCGDAINAPEKIRKDNVKRYCLPCSELTGKLVERVCIATVSRRAKAAARAKEQREKAAAKTKAALEKAKAQAAEEIKKYPWNLYTLFEGWKKLDCWDDPANLKDIHLEIHKKRRGIYTEIVMLAGAKKGFLMKAGTDMGEAVYRLVATMVRVGSPEHEQMSTRIRFAKQILNIEITHGHEFRSALKTLPMIQCWARSKKAKFPVPLAPKKRKAPPLPKSKLARTIAKREKESDW